jgi:hypothetical protein
VSKWFEVTLTAHKVVAVEMEDDATEADAEHFASLEADFGFQDIVESNTVELIGDHKISTAVRHADQVERL